MLNMSLDVEESQVRMVLEFRCIRALFLCTVAPQETTNPHPVFDSLLQDQIVSASDVAGIFSSD